MRDGEYSDIQPNTIVVWTPIPKEIDENPVVWLTGEVLKFARNLYGYGAEIATILMKLMKNL